MTIDERIDESVRRITEGFGPMRIPADKCDADLVLTDAKAEITSLRAEVASLRAALEGLWEWQGTVQEVPSDELSAEVRAALAGRGPEARWERSLVEQQREACAQAVEWTADKSESQELSMQAAGALFAEAIRATSLVTPDAKPSPDVRGLLEAVDAVEHHFEVPLPPAFFDAMRALAAKRKEWP